MTQPNALLAPRAGTPRRRDELIEQHLGLARHFARRFAGKGESLDDLEQVACLGLVLAAERFDPDRGHRFASFAAPTIVGELKRHLRDKAWGTRVPRRLKELNAQVNAAVTELGHAHGRSPTIAEIADRVGITEEQVLEATEAGHAYRPLSLDQPSRGDDERGESFVARLGGPDPTVDLVAEVASVRPALEALPARDRELLRLRFSEELSQREIAQRLGVSQVHVSRLLQRCLTTVRSLAGVEEEPQATG
jgi:RNA polymerase sigma-B factor